MTNLNIKVTFDTPLDNNEYAVNTTTTTGINCFNMVFNKANTGFSVWTREGTNNNTNRPFNFTVISSTPIAVGGGSGSYTPEKMVWSEDLFVSNERAVNTEYTNTNDTPLYVQLFLNLSKSGNQYVDFLIDDKSFGSIGSKNIDGQTSSYNTPVFIVPSGSKYKCVKPDGTSIDAFMWHEAKMPVAVGTGGGSGWKETVLFENEAGQTTNFALSESYDSFDYLRFDTIKTDGTADGNLKRSDMFPVDICNRLVIDNYYNFYMYLNCDDKTNFTVVGADTVALLKVVGINTGSGGGSGDSIWTEEGGTAVYNGPVDLGPVETEQKFNVL